MRKPFALVTAILIAAGCLVIFSSSVRETLYDYKYQLTTRERPERELGSDSAGHIKKRQSEVAVLRDKIAIGDTEGAAEINSRLVQEALVRANAVAELWLRNRSPRYGLLPKQLAPGTSNYIWNYRDCAADCYSHLAIQSLLCPSDHLAATKEILATERRLNPALPAPYDLNTGKRISESPQDQMFGAIEYAKDGLLPLLEIAGETEWYQRLHELLEAILDSSSIPSDFGKLPSNGSEKNGELLQVLARLFQKTHNERYLEMGRRISDAYVGEVLPGNGGIPAHLWNFTTHQPIRPELRLRDHGNEIIAGLAEWFVAEKEIPNGQAERYRPAIERMLNILLEKARHRDGMWMNKFHLTAQPPPLADGKAGPNDNWGYLYAAYVAYAFALPEGNPIREKYLAETRRAVRAMAGYRSAPWEGGHFDGYCDALESAIYLLESFDEQETSLWVDSEIANLFAYQKADGRIAGNYLDGNFVRTALLYAQMKTAGVRLEPWSAALHLGACKRPDGGWNFHIQSSQPWSGRIIFDRPRHRENMGLAFEYPRLNGWPEWLTIAENDSCDVSINGAAAQLIDGRSMREGRAVELMPNQPVRWVVRRHN